MRCHISRSFLKSGPNQRLIATIVSNAILWPLIVCKKRAAAGACQTADHNAFLAAEQAADKSADPGADADVKGLSVSTINIRPFVIIAIVIVVVSGIIVITPTVVSPVVVSSPVRVAISILRR